MLSCPNNTLDSLINKGESPYNGPRSHSLLLLVSIASSSASNAIKKLAISSATPKNPSLYRRGYGVYHCPLHSLHRCHPLHSFHSRSPIHSLHRCRPPPSTASNTAKTLASVVTPLTASTTIAPSTTSTTVAPSIASTIVVAVSTHSASSANHSALCGDENGVSRSLRLLA
jgi:hypothetical protein